MTESSLYRMFGSRDSIVLEVYNRFWDLVLEDIRGIANSPWKEPPAKKLERIVSFALNFVTKNLDLIKVIAGTRLLPPEKVRDSAVRERRLDIRRKNREVLAYVDKIIEEGQQEGQFVADLRPQVIRQILMGAFQTLAYGLFIQFERSEPVGYEPSDALAGINYVLGMVSCRK